MNLDGGQVTEIHDTEEDFVHIEETESDEEENVLRKCDLDV
jgi:hypothetical protein